MRGLATTTRDWWLSGGLHQWRRSTGILRAHLREMPLSAFVDPAGAETLRRMGAMAEHQPVSATVAIGYWGQRARVRLHLLPWTAAGVAAIEVAALEELPLSSWWLPSSAYAECPPTPHSCMA